MADRCTPIRLLAIIGLATLCAGVHALIVPVRLTRESQGFVIPPERDSSEPREADPATPPDPGAQTTSEAGEGKIGLELAARLHERFMNGEPIWFLDARLARDFEAGRISGALHMSHTRLSSGDGLEEIMLYSPPEAGDLLIIYCTGGDCQASEDTAILLEAAGYTNIAIMAAGFDEWLEAGLPVEGVQPGGAP